MKMHNMTSSVYAVTMVTVMMALVYCVDARVNSRARSTPACYRNYEVWGSTSEVCQHPLYTTCREYGNSTTNHVCCGPDHYCCKDGLACCRKATNAYEVVGVVFGALAWIAILIIAGIFVFVHIVRIVKSRKKKRKIHPK